MEVCLSIEHAERIAKAGTLTEQAVKKILSEILERTTGEPLHTYTVKDWVNEWLAGKKQTKSAGTAERYKQVTREFLESLGTRANLSLEAITPKDIRSYQDSALSAGKSPKTVNNGVMIVSVVFNAALRQGYITTNPCRALESLPVEKTERGTFTSDQVAKLVSAAEGDWKGAILFAYYTGARLRDVANMRWTEIDLERRLITFTPSKTKTKVAIPLHPELELHLMKSPGIGKALLFPNLAGHNTGGVSGLSGKFSTIMVRAGIVGAVKNKTRGKGRTVRTLTFHSLRHSFNSAMANAGVSQEVRQKLTGHASPEMNKLYTHHELEPLRAAIATLPKITTKAS